MPEVPRWRLDDVAAYDEMRETAATVAAALIASQDALAAASILRDAAAVHSFTRAKIDTFAQRLTGGESAS